MNWFFKYNQEDDDEDDDEDEDEDDDDDDDDDDEPGDGKPRQAVIPSWQSFDLTGIRRSLWSTTRPLHHHQTLPSLTRTFTPMKHVNNHVSLTTTTLPITLFFVRQQPFFFSSNSFAACIPSSCHWIMPEQWKNHIHLVRKQACLPPSSSILFFFLLFANQIRFN